MPDAALFADPLWYKDAIIYQLHDKAFFDASGDGIGDFQGLTRKLDYLEDLGVTALWLLPFYPSPLRDDGYDIADYRGFNPAYGTRADFLAFIRAAHARGMRVITELVINHTSDQHPWFQRARYAKRGSHEGPEIGHVAVSGVDVLVVGDVVAVIAQRRGIERQQPQRGDAEILEVVELPRDAGEIADAVVVRIEERLHVQLVYDRVLEPNGIAAVESN